MSRIEMDSLVGDTVDAMRAQADVDGVTVRAELPHVFEAIYRGRLESRQRDRETGAAQWRVGATDSAAVCLGDRLDDREAKS